MNTLAEEKLPDISSDSVATGHVQTPKDLLSKLVPGSSKGTLDSAELLEVESVPVALEAGTTVGQRQLTSHPQPNTHILHATWSQQ